MGKQIPWNDAPASGNDELDAFLSDVLDTVLPVQVQGDDIFWRSGSGSPEGLIPARLGSLYSDVTNGVLYVKEADDRLATGWVAK